MDSIPSDHVQCTRGGSSASYIQLSSANAATFALMLALSTSSTSTFIVSIRHLLSTSLPSFTFRLHWHARVIDLVVPNSFCQFLSFPCTHRRHHKHMIFLQHS